MSLRSVVNVVTGAVNPNTRLVFNRSDGYSTNPDGSRVPRYKPPVDLYAQVQTTRSSELKQIDGLNQQGTYRTVYISGRWHGAVRVSKRGGDTIMFPDGSVWLTTAILERWPAWTKAVLTLQDGG